MSDTPGSLSDKPFPLDPRALVGVIQHDIAAILRALGLGDHARPVSAHAVVLDEILPAIKRQREELQFAAIRLGILVDRMEGCNAEAEEKGRPPTHELLDEAREFENLARRAVDLEKR